MFVTPFQQAARPDAGSSVTVLSYKWFKSRQAVEKLDAAGNDVGAASPVRAVTSANKNFERNMRVNAPAGTRDPNADTLDGRSAELERNVQEARTQKTKPVDGYAYRMKVQNTSVKTIEVVFLEYQFDESADATSIVRRQFLCGVHIKPHHEKELQAFSLSGPSDVIDVAHVKDAHANSGNLLAEQVVINRVEYSDGSIWQRKGWNLAQVKLGVQRATATPWGTEMCRGL
jgi:hypothetical protein